jgi:16S rRNA (guanine966-N2)-methyltransferase
MFMALEPLEGLRVVDLYAGSGALAIEALSRGAAHADLVESEPGARRVLERNLAALELNDKSRVWRLALPRGFDALSQTLAAADLVLMDPPYGGREAAVALRTLGEPGCLRPGTRVVLEHHAKDEIPERAGALARIRQRAYGETVVTTFRADGVASAGDEETVP